MIRLRRVKRSGIPSRPIRTEALLAIASSLPVVSVIWTAIVFVGGNNGPGRYSWWNSGSLLTRQLHEAQPKHNGGLMSFLSGWVHTYVVLVILTGLAGCAALPQPKTATKTPIPSGEVGHLDERPVVQSAPTSTPVAPLPKSGSTVHQPIVTPVAFSTEQQLEELPAALPLTPQPVHSKDHDVLDLTYYINQVLERNRSLQAMVAAWRSAAQRYPQAVSLDDPIFQSMTAPGSWNSNNVTPAYAFSGSQKFPWMGKRSLRGEVASAEATAASFDVADLRLQLTQAAQLAYLDYFLVHRQLEIIETNLQRLEEFREAARRRYEANLAMQQDVLQAEVELAEAQRQQIELRRKLRAAIARINTLLHLPPDLPVPPPPTQISVEREPAPAEILRQAAIEQRPDLRAIAAKLQAESASLGLAYKEFFPDIELVARYDSFWQPISTQGALQAQVGVNMNVPIYLQKRRAAVREAIFKLQQKRAEYEQRVDDIQREVEATHAEVVEMREVVKLYTSRSLVFAQRNVESARADYIAGRSDFLRLVTAQRQLLMLQEKHIEAVAGYVSRLADLERVVGGAVPLEPAREEVPAKVQ